MKRRTDPAAWPNHLRHVFAAVGREMAGKRLSTEVVEQLPSGVDAILPDHKVRVTHLTGEAAGPAGNRYEITIDGPRIVGSWSFRAGDLETLARASHAGEVP